MSDNGSETPIVADVEEVQAEVEAPKGKMSVEDALQVRRALLHSNTIPLHLFTPSLPPCRPVQPLEPSALALS